MEAWCAGEALRSERYRGSRVEREKGRGASKGGSWRSEVEGRAPASAEGRAGEGVRSKPPNPEGSMIEAMPMSNSDIEASSERWLYVEGA